MENSEYIESYFNNELSGEEKNIFEQKIISDREFAEEVAFYYSVHQAAKDELNAEKKKRFIEIYQQNQPHQKIADVKQLWIRVAAAAIIVGIIFGAYFFLFTKQASPQQMADEYVKENFSNLSVTMSSKQDSMQAALSLYNDGKLAEIGRAHV